MKKTLLILISLILLTQAACASKSSETNSSAAGTTSGGKKITWKLGHITDENHPWHKTSLKFAELVKQKTNDQIEIKIFPNSQLGGEIDTLNSIKSGTADLTISGESMANWAPKAALMAVPYEFRDEDHMKKVIESDIGKEIEQDISEKVEVTPLYYHLRAPRNLTSDKPINTLDDIKGFRMRVPNVPLFLDAWKSVGAKPQAMDFKEVFTALQQHVIDGQENPYDLIFSASFYEVQKYVNQTEHVRQWVYMVVGNKQLESLTPELQEAVKEAAKEAQAYGSELFAKDIAEYRQKLIDKGMKINEEVDRDAFKKAMEPAIKSSLKKEQLELYDKIQNFK